jgi:hypothetical protein
MRVVVLLVVAALAAPAAASAEPQWVHDSPISEQSAGYLLCAGSDGSSVFDEILPAIDYAEAFIDQADLPPRGGIQSVRVQWWATGGDYCARWSPTGTTIELILPPGVELALGPANPALCGFSVTQDAAVCPVLTGPGCHGGTILRRPLGQAGAVARHRRRQQDPPDPAGPPHAPGRELRPQRGAALQRRPVPARPGR